MAIQRTGNAQYAMHQNVRCSLYSMYCTCKIGVWRSMSSLHHFSSTIPNPFPFQREWKAIPFDSQKVAFKVVYIAHHILEMGNVENRPLECIRIDEQELKFLCIFHFNFKHSSFTFDRMPSTTIVLYFVWNRDATKPWIWIHFVKVYILYSIVKVFVFCAFCISKIIIFFVLFQSFILHLFSFSLYLLALLIHSEFLFTFELLFGMVKVAIHGNHDMIAQYAISTQDKLCVWAL